MQDKCEKMFDKYLESYDKSVKEIRFKYYHSYEVEKLMEKLANMLDLDSKEIEIAKVVGLLHDVGRFEQIRKYGKCSDVLTNTDHAHESVIYLFQSGHIRDFIDDSSYDKVIEDAIENHNKYAVDKKVKGKNLFFSKMIRDMDKVDIYRVISEEYKYTFDKEEISSDVIKSFSDKKTVNNIDRKTETDGIIAQMALIFDINFKESFQILKETKYLDKYFEIITVKKDSKSYFDDLKEEIYNYLEEKCK